MARVREVEGLLALDQPGKAIEKTVQTVALLTASNDQHPLLIDALSALARAEAADGDDAAALDHYRQVLQLAGDSDDREVPSRLDAAAEVARNVGRPELVETFVLRQEAVSRRRLQQYGESPVAGASRGRGGPVDARLAEPDAAWSPVEKKMGFVRDCVTEIRDGKLLLADRGMAPGSYAYFQNLGAVCPDDEVVVEVRLKLLSGWSCVLVENGVAGEEMMFYPHRLTLRHSGLSSPMKTADAFHTYRIIMHQQDRKVYADGQRRSDGSERFTHPAPNGRSGVAFGDANSPSVGAALGESVRIRNPAVSLLDAALSIRHGAGG